MSEDQASFLREPEALSPAAQALYAEDAADPGYVMNASRLWSHHADEYQTLLGLARSVSVRAGLTDRDRAVLLLSMTSTVGDSYCSLVWGGRLAAWASDDVAAAILDGRDGPLDARERVLSAWARAVAADPNGITAAHVDALRDVGYDDTKIHAITCYVAVRLAITTVNDALGARPDAGLRATTPAAVVEAVTYGRPVAG